MTDIICVHPIKSGLKFLKPIIRELRGKHKERFKYLKLSDSDRSHEICLKELNSSKDSIVLILSHGVNNHIIGCIYSPRSSNPDSYSYDCFINIDNIHVLKDKKIFCLTCNSAERIGKWAINSGATVFVGFDMIRFDYKKNIKMYNNDLEYSIYNNSIISLSKYALRKIISQAINIAIDRNYTFNQLVLYLRLLINLHSEELVIKPKFKSYRHRNEVAAILQEIKSGIRIFGNGEIRMNN